MMKMRRLCSAQQRGCRARDGAHRRPPYTTSAGVDRPYEKVRLPVVCGSGDSGAALAGQRETTSPAWRGVLCAERAPT